MTVEDEVRAALDRRVEAGELPGYVAVVADAQAEWVHATGTTAFGGGAPMRRDTPFQITSMTKPIIAAVAMSLVDEGALALDEPVDRLLPELAAPRVLTRLDGPLTDTVPADRAITVEDVLTYRMGFGFIPEPFNPPEWPVIAESLRLDLALAEPDPRTPHGPDEWIKRFGTLPLLDQPGTVWRYNASGLVLGVLVARAAGRPLPEVLAERLTGPLGMTHTGFHLPPAEARRLPTRYFQGETPPVATAEQWSVPPVFPSAAAGLASTADDVLAFGRMLLSGGGGVLSRESVTAMTTNHLTPEQITGGGIFLDGSGWGYGLSVTAHEYGWAGGYGTFWCNAPGRGRIGILLTQVSDTLFDGTQQEFADLIIS